MKEVLLIGLALLMTSCALFEAQKMSRTDWKVCEEVYIARMTDVEADVHTSDRAIEEYQEFGCWKGR